MHQEPSGSGEQPCIVWGCFIMKDLQWFKFSPLNWMTGRIRKEPEKIQIAFLELMCQYWKNGCKMTIDQASLEIGEKIQVLLKRKIVKVEGDNIKISFLDEQILSIEDTSVIRSKAALSRWNKVQSKSMQVHASALQDNANGMQSDADKIRQDKTREDKINLSKNFSDDFYQSASEAFEEIKNDQIQMERLLMIVRNSGFRACNEVTMTLAMRHFFTVESAKPGFLNRPRDEIKQHLVNWTNKNAKTIDQYAK